MPKFRLKRPPVVVARHLLKETFVETIAWLGRFKLFVQHTDEMIVFRKDGPATKTFYEAELGNWIVMTIDQNGGALQIGIYGDAAFHEKYELDLPSDEPEIHQLLAPHPKPFKHEHRGEPAKRGGHSKPAYVPHEHCNHPETCDVH